MPLFFVVVLSLALIILAFLWHRVVVAPAWRSRVVQALLTVLLLALTASMFLALGPWLNRWTPAQARPLALVGTTWMAWALYLVLGLGAVWLVAVGAWLHSRGRGRAVRSRINRAGLALVVVASGALTAYGFWRASEPVVTPISYASPALPKEFDGMKVALVTDLHAGAIRSAEFTAKVVERVNATQPDIVILGGDLIDGEADRFAPEIAPLADLQARHGVFAVTGNHEMFTRDLPAWLADWKSLGITVLANESAKVTVSGATIDIVGVNDYNGTGTYAADAGKAFRGVDPAGFAIFVAHQPRQAWNAQGRGVDLQLSGHTHGGQLWPMRYVVPLQQPMVDGYAVLGDVPTITSRGAGAWGPAVRVGADPQIPVITLHTLAR